MKALILVDLQNDFLPGGALAVPQGEAILPLANRLQSCFKLAVVTQDWHPPNHGSFAANHAGRVPGEVISLARIPQLLWPVHCVQNTRGAELAPGLIRSRINRVFKKGTDPAFDSYSGFFDNGHERATGLSEYFKDREVTDVYVAGFVTEYSVKFTALDAVALGFKTFVVEDACRGLESKPGEAVAAIEEMKKAGVRMVQSRDLLDGPMKV